MSDFVYESEYERNGYPGYTGVNMSSCQKGECDGCIDARDEALQAHRLTHQCKECRDVLVYCLCKPKEPSDDSPGS